MSKDAPITISLYELYTMGLVNFHDKAPWEKSPKITTYHQSFVTEERLLAMAILYLLGEEYVPAQVINTMAPKYRNQVRDSVNRAVFIRALKHFFRHHSDPNGLANKTIERMESYITIIRESRTANEDPLEATTYTLAKRVPPRSKEQLDHYEQSVERIMDYVEDFVDDTLKSGYVINDL